MPQGHDNQSGKLDLMVRYAEKALIDVEVKMTDAEDADTCKQRGYGQWIKEQTEVPKDMVKNNFPTYLSCSILAR